LNSYAYTPPAFALPCNKNKKKPRPVQLMEQYIRWHSVDALRRDPHHRKFSVVFYSCPLQAGNRIHHFTTSVYWSIVTNRTMLYKYWDRETCYRYGSMYSLAICREANTDRDCDKILARAPWIPSFAEWRDVLGLQPDGGGNGNDPYSVPFYATHPRDVVNFRFPWGPGNDESVRGVDGSRYDSIPLVMFAQTRSKIAFMDPRNKKHAGTTLDELLVTGWGRGANARLHGLGVDFMFGMILRYSFDLTGAVQAAVPPGATDLLLFRGAGGRGGDCATQDLEVRDGIDDESYGDDDAQTDDNDAEGDDDEVPYYTIALHSRHIDDAVDGCDVSREIGCMKELLKTKMPPGKRCAVALLSDRACTLSTLVPWLEDEQRGCVAYVARHDARTDYLSEHGPFAGVGFFQDLALTAAVARSAFVGMHRSSSDLVLELVQFYRTMDAWERSGETTDEKLRWTIIDQCILNPVEPPKPQPFSDGMRVDSNTTGIPP
jgi:hypothetical protein